MTIALVPMGSLKPGEIEQAKDAIEKTFVASVVVEDEIRMPAEAYYSPRKRYRADKLNEFLSREYKGASRVVGLTSKDISTTYRGSKDWGVFGLADGEDAVVSVHRFQMHKEPQSVADVRMRKCVLHELGHTFGLDHCRDKKCLMQDGEGGLVTTDRADESFCAECRKKLAGILREAHA